ncbi:recombinase family protein [Motilibacter aurantiacus]|uniref:recombinase family protein n=1 Tax=Motilibacter aurantiacus TaxID=2714955 RepID=UPI00140C32CB|nr:recombinase family protein [Motilibacter aurantiacus]NHC44551.1 recombinase family protein [Motilibacter aurantiacus]
MRKRSERVLGYLRVSTEEQAASGLGLADQRAVIETEAQRRGWHDLHLLMDDGYSAKNLQRPAIGEALAALASGDAGILVVSKLDRLSRSLLDFATLMDRARREGWQLVVLDLALDTTTPSGQLMANVMACFAQYERQLIGHRTSAALQQKKAQGARLGRPRSLPASVVRRIVEERAGGATLTAIAAGLDADHVPTAQGGVRWYPATVAAVLRSHSLDVYTAAAAPVGDGQVDQTTARL